MSGQMAELGLGLQGDLLSVPSGKSMVLEAAKDGAVSVAKYPFEHPHAVVGLVLPIALSLIPQRLFAAESFQAGKPVSPTENVGDLIKTFALPLILGTGNAYRAWHSAGQDVSQIQNEIDRRIEEANDVAGITSVDDIVWQTISKQFRLDPDMSPEERESVFSKIDQASLEKLKVSAEQELGTIPETVAKLTTEISGLSKKRNKIWRRGAWRIPFEFGEGFLVGCFGMALIQPDGTPTVVEKFLNSTDAVEQTKNGLYLSGYTFASWTALRAMWKLQHAAGGRGAVADQVKAHLKRMKEDAGEEVKNDQKPKLSDQARAMGGDTIAQVKMRMKNGK